MNQQINELAKDCYAGNLTQKEAARRAGCHPRTIYNIGRREGFVIPRKRWTSAELAILEAHAHLPCEWIQTALQAGGFVRSLAAIQFTRNRLHGTIAVARENADILTASELARFLGVHATSIQKWIREGVIKGARVDGIGHPEYGVFHIRRRDAKKFVIEHSVRLPQHGVNVVWLVDLLAEGR